MLLALGACVLVAGCKPAVDKHAVTASTPVCTDTSETRAIACSEGAARRHGDTLFLRIGSTERRMIDTAHGDFERTYRYVGKVGRAGLQVYTLRGYEGPWESHLINPVSGREVSVMEDITVSPDAERFFTDKSDWNDCEGEEPGLEVWRLTDSLPVLEWRLKPNSCNTPAGWGAVDAKWRGPDTLNFFRSYALDHGPQARYAHEPMTAVRDAQGWRLVGDRSHPSENPAPIMSYVEAPVECYGRTCTVTHAMACRAFMADSLAPHRHGTDVIPGDSLEVFGSLLIVERPGVIAFDGPVSGANGGEALPTVFQRGDTLYLLEYLGDTRWTWWWHGRSGSSRFDWLDSTATVRAGMRAARVAAPLYARWTTIMREPRGREGSEWTYVKAQPGMWATEGRSCGT